MEKIVVYDKEKAFVEKVTRNKILVTNKNSR